MRNAEYIGIGLFAALLALPFAGNPTGTHADHTGESWSHPHVVRDLAQIKRDTLRVLVLPDPLSWEERPGAMTGLEWELLERFARRHRMPIKAVPVENRDSMLVMLQNGRGDVIAAQLSPSGWAAPYTHLTRFYRQVARVHAVPRPDGTKDAGPTVADTLTVSAWSPFLDSTQVLSTVDSGSTVRIVDLLPEELLIEIALGRGHCLLVSDATAAMEAKRLPLVKFRPREGRSVPLAFAVRTNATHLLHALDTWLASAKEYEARQALIAAYDNGLDTRDRTRPLRTMAFGTDSISRFDSLFQAHADSLTWDWKLLAAMAFKESGFDTSAVSRAGAGGLMQMMPTTAALMGVTRAGGVNDHIQGASRYLDRLDRIWRNEIPAPAQRLKFVLAAYNAGPGHVKDAQRLALELGMDPQRWDGNVERAIVLLNRPRYFTSPSAKTGYCRGQDTYWYVREVEELYAWLSGRR
ncbi:MAG: transglycosylase SLT domain-containing protein [Flavobacteriales bacterium]|nr:transglycosylase SLT domain-containing protein [Flavobacteriales bacterium]